MKSKSMSFDTGELQSKWERFNAKMAFNADARASMYEDLGAFIAAGLPPFEAIKGILEVHTLRKSPLRYMTEEWVAGFERGKSLAGVMEGWADPAEVAMIASGEKSGSLQSSIMEVAELTRAKSDMVGHAKGQLAAPLVQIAALFGLVFYISSTVVPAAKRLLPDKYIPDFARGYFSFGEFFITWGPWIALAVVIMFTIIFATSQKWVGEWRDRFDTFFPWTLFRGLQGAFFLITLSAMMKSGMPMPAAIAEMQRFSNPWLKEHLARMRFRLEKGRREASAMDTGLLMPAMSDRLLIYDRLPNFTTVMRSMGRDAIVDVRKSINKTTATVNVVVMLLIAVFIMATIFALGETSFAISDAVESKTRMQ